MSYVSVHRRPIKQYYTDLWHIHMRVLQLQTCSCVHYRTDCTAIKYQGPLSIKLYVPCFLRRIAEAPGRPVQEGHPAEEDRVGEGGGGHRRGHVQGHPQHCQAHPPVPQAEEQDGQPLGVPLRLSLAWGRTSRRGNGRVWELGGTELAVPVDFQTLATESCTASFAWRQSIH